MADAFRDGLQAALERAEHLEDENELLRDEIARLRESTNVLRQNATELPPDSSPAARALAVQALDVLEKLESVSQRRAQLRGKPAPQFRYGAELALDAKSGPTRVAEADEPRSAAVSVDAPPPRPVVSETASPAPAPTRKAGGGMRAIIPFVAIAFFLLGFVIGRC